MSNSGEELEGRTKAATIRTVGCLAIGRPLRSITEA